MPSLEASWAFGCGLVASGRLTWLPAQSLRVLTAWLAIDVLLGYAVRHWCTLKAAGGGAQTPSWQPLVIPYAQPGSPGASLAAWLNGPLARWRENDFCFRQAAQSGVALITGFGVALLLATYAGPGPLAVVATGGVGLALVALTSNQNVASFHRWSCAIQIVLAWTMGHIALGGWGADSLSLATLFGLGLLVGSVREREGSTFARGLTRVIWCVLTGTMLISRQPAAAAGIGICGLASDMSASGGDRRSVGKTAVLTQRIAWMAAAMTSALALAYWG